MNPKTENNPYLGFVYTSFQERATKISHGNTARFAKDHGDETLAKICGIIAADEGRHEIAYQRIIDEVMKRDQDGAVLAFADMMKKQIVMPAHLMDDGEHRARTGRDLFSDFATVAEATARVHRRGLRVHHGAPHQALEHRRRQLRVRRGGGGAGVPHEAARAHPQARGLRQEEEGEDPPREGVLLLDLRPRGGGVFQLNATRRRWRSVGEPDGTRDRPRRARDAAARARGVG